MALAVGVLSASVLSFLVWDGLRWIWPQKPFVLYLSLAALSGALPLIVGMAVLARSHRPRPGICIILIVTGVIVIACSLLVAPVVLRKHRQVLLTSCWNHAIMMDSQLEQFYFMKTNSLPFESGVPGYEMFARTIGGFGVRGMMNCNHGAPGVRIGGWQAINLSPKQWESVVSRWSPKDWDDGVPFCWCGRATGLGKRLVFATRDGRSLNSTELSEEELTARIARLNGILEEMGHKATSLNVPKNIDWKDYDTIEE